MPAKTIITDIEKLHQKSERIDRNAAETEELLLDLKHSLPKGQLGLAAPQIDVHKSVFIAWLPALEKTFGFVNPSFTEMSDTKVDSTEGCLSLPRVTRTVERCAYVTIDADRIVEFTDGTDVLHETFGPIELVGLESFIVQHEYDHLNGVLLIDHEAIQSRAEKLQEKAAKRQAKIHSKRQARKATKRAVTSKVGADKPKSKKELEKEKKRARKQRKREKRTLEIAERYRAEQEGLFDPTA